MTNEISPLQGALAQAGGANNSKNGKSASWFEAMAEAWGEALDAQAAKIESLSEGVADGFESPAQITELTAESLRMGYISNSSHTSITSVASALETLARKQ